MAEDMQARMARMAQADAEHERKWRQGTVDQERELRTLANELIAIQRTVPEAAMLASPSVAGDAQPYYPGIDLWRYHWVKPASSDYGASRHVATPLVPSGIFYDPIEAHWVSDWITHRLEPMPREQIVEYFSEALASWTLHQYPGLVQKEAEDRERERLEAERQRNFRNAELAKQLVRWFVVIVIGAWIFSAIT